MVQVTLKRMFEKGRITFELPSDVEIQNAIKNELIKCHDKHNDYVLVTMQSPKRPRTIGKDSQSHHLNGHIMQICSSTGNDYETVKYCVKMLAVEQMGYPFKNIGKHVLPQTERECSTEDCAKLIEAVHILASELNIILQE